MLGKFKIETPKNIWIDEFVCVGSKIYAFICGNESKNKLKGVPRSYFKKINFEEYYNCLFGGEFQKECDKYILRSVIHDLYLQRVKKPTLSIFDDKRCYINETESKPWN